jgi:hypothetical protein
MRLMTRFTLSRMGSTSPRGKYDISRRSKMLIAPEPGEPGRLDTLFALFAAAPPPGALASAAAALGFRIRSQIPMPRAASATSSAIQGTVFLAAFPALLFEFPILYLKLHIFLLGSMYTRVMFLVLMALACLTWLLYTDFEDGEGFEANDPSLRPMVIDASR